MKHLFLSIFAFCVCFTFNICHANQYEYKLDVTFDMANHQLNGLADITYPANRPLHLNLSGLAIHQISIQEKGKHPVQLPLPAGDTIQLYASKYEQQLSIHYSLQTTEQNTNNQITDSGIVLTSNWHPLPDHPMLFSLRAQLPPSFKAISESDTVDTTQESSLLQTSFSQKVQTIHLAAGPYQIEKEQIRNNLSLSTWFFPEDSALSSGYLEAAKAYILRYEQEIGPFPYSHYAIVANRLPSGFGMPTFTLLGQQVLRLPFIKETSLGHEILHSWFGNAITIKNDSGNWCEGLTSYLADFAYAKEKGQGAEYRKNSLSTYQSYVHENSQIAVQDFHSASHNQPLSKQLRAVGYTRAAIFFHMLRGVVGPELFTLAIRHFVAKHMGQEASWEDIKKSFETVSKRDLSVYFNEQLTRTDLPVLAASDITSATREDNSVLSFTLVQKNSSPYTLQVPIVVSTFEGEKSFTVHSKEKETTVELLLPDPPLSFTIDPHYDLFRTLDPSELSPVWSRFLGSENILMVTDEEERAVFSPFLRWATENGWQSISSDKLQNKNLSQHSLLFTNSHNTGYSSLFAPSKTDNDGFGLQVFSNPLNQKEVVVLLSSKSAAETKAALPKLSHYGKYSSLSFVNGRIKNKDIQNSANGIRYVLESLPTGGATTTIDSFANIINKLTTKRVIYLGETHDSAADHLLQLRIIQALHKRGAQLVLAMEMFPSSSQRVLDRYVLERQINEETFLRSCHWFDIWRFDWRLFRPIFNYCRQEHIPIHGINLDKAIVSTVFEMGNTDTLSKEQQGSIAKERDLSLPGYVNRLQDAFRFHQQSPHGKTKNLSGFIQSQAIWDETMAKNIQTLLDDYPESTILVIAGSQHTRKDSGIPPRLKRRKPISQATVINLLSNAHTDPATEADFFFIQAPFSLPALGKIGVILSSEKDENGEDYLQIKELSHAGNAKKSGVEKGDILLSINNHRVNNMEDIEILMRDARVGDKVILQLKRQKQGEDEAEIEKEVVLSDLSKPAGHP